MQKSEQTIEKTVNMLFGADNCHFAALPDENKPEALRSYVHSLFTTIEIDDEHLFYIKIEPLATIVRQNALIDALLDPFMSEGNFTALSEFLAVLAHSFRSYEDQLIYRSSTRVLLSLLARLDPLFDRHTETANVLKTLLVQSGMVWQIMSALVNGPVGSRKAYPPNPKDTFVIPCVCRLVAMFEEPVPNVEGEMVAVGPEGHERQYQSQTNAVGTEIIMKLWATVKERDSNFLKFHLLLGAVHVLTRARDRDMMVTTQLVVILDQLTNDVKIPVWRARGGEPKELLRPKSIRSKTAVSDATDELPSWVDTYDIPAKLLPRPGEPGCDASGNVPLATIAVLALDVVAAVWQDDRERHASTQPGKHDVVTEVNELGAADSKDHASWPEVFPGLNHIDLGGSIITRPPFTTRQFVRSVAPKHVPAILRDFHDQTVHRQNLHPAIRYLRALLLFTEDQGTGQAQVRRGLRQALAEAPTDAIRADIIKTFQVSVAFTPCDTMVQVFKDWLSELDVRKATLTLLRESLGVWSDMTPPDSHPMVQLMRPVREMIRANSTVDEVVEETGALLVEAATLPALDDDADLGFCIVAVKALAPASIETPLAEMPVVASTITSTVELLCQMDSWEDGARRTLGLQTMAAVLEAGLVSMVEAGQQGAWARLLLDQVVGNKVPGMMAVAVTETQLLAALLEALDADARRSLLESGMFEQLYQPKTEGAAGLIGWRSGFEGGIVALLGLLPVIFSDTATVTGSAWPAARTVAALTAITDNMKSVDKAPTREAAIRATLTLTGPALIGHIEAIQAGSAESQEAVLQLVQGLQERLDDEREALAVLACQALGQMIPVLGSQADGIRASVTTLRHAGKAGRPDLGQAAAAVFASMS
ncbi:hypothetical protein J8273_8303 [Carpediemonas membranifera]|uniref:Uncharacterized protein n=1 Tax=Carpediemonas membranifera TaxID=201153 RepID=A0A8J6DZ55_9EUKA|nr:hypothetical protein J8273_8303 [Carpediemonas membranifera]|eukprot:KAG9390263.1 hypothetical protein J8273_8303 [Carpediemonas membranifera]